MKNSPLYLLRVVHRAHYTLSYVFDIYNKECVNNLLFVLNSQNISVIQYEEKPVIFPKNKAKIRYYSYKNDY